MVRKNVDHQDFDHGIVSDYISKPKIEEIANFLRPEINPETVNEFEISGICSLAFVKLFLLGQADPTFKCRQIAGCALLTSAHLLRYKQNQTLHFTH